MCLYAIGAVLTCSVIRNCVCVEGEEGGGVDGWKAIAGRPTWCAKLANINM